MGTITGGIALYWSVGSILATFYWLLTGCSFYSSVIIGALSPMMLFAIYAEYVGYDRGSDQKRKISPISIVSGVIILLTLSLATAICICRVGGFVKYNEILSFARINSEIALMAIFSGWCFWKIALFIFGR